MVYKIKKEVLIVLVVIVILLLVFYGGNSQDCNSEISSSQCDFLTNPEQALKCYQNLSFYTNEPCLCERLDEGARAPCYYEFAINARNDDVCSTSALKEYTAEDGSTGSDLCYLAIVENHANYYSRRLTFKEITRLCNKIKNPNLEQNCFKSQKFARNETE